MALRKSAEELICNLSESVVVDLLCSGVFSLEEIRSGWPGQQNIQGPKSREAVHDVLRTLDNI